MLRRTGVYFHVFPSLKQGRRDLWDNIIQTRTDGIERSTPMISMFPKHLIDRKLEDIMQIKLKGNGSIYQVMGCDTEEAVESLRGPNPVGIIFSEYAHMEYGKRAWDTLSPVLAENNGWAAFVYTPNGKNHGWDLWQMAERNAARPNSEWFVQRLTVDDTRRDAVGEDGSPVITTERIVAERTEGKREEFIQQEYFCSFEGYLHGSIYGDLVTAARAEGRIGAFPYIPTLPVGVCMDLGKADATAAWFYQIYDRKIVFIDYHEETQRDLRWWVHLMRERKPYVYGRIVLPWDGGRGAEDFFSTVGFRNVQVCERGVVQAEIDAVRRAFSTFYFDMRCGRGLESLEKYAREFDEEAHVFSTKPIHNQWSHGADALRTGIAGGLEPLEFIENMGKPVKVETDFDPRLTTQETPMPYGRLF